MPHQLPSAAHACRLQEGAAPCVLLPPSCAVFLPRASRAAATQGGCLERPWPPLPRRLQGGGSGAASWIRFSVYSAGGNGLRGEPSDLRAYSAGRRTLASRRRNPLRRRPRGTPPARCLLCCGGGGPFVKHNPPPIRCNKDPCKPPPHLRAQRTQQRKRRRILSACLSTPCLVSSLRLAASTNIARQACKQVQATCTVWLQAGGVPLLPRSVPDVGPPNRQPSSAGRRTSPSAGRHALHVRAVPPPATCTAQLAAMRSTYIRYHAGTVGKTAPPLSWPPCAPRRCGSASHQLPALSWPPCAHIHAVCHLPRVSLSWPPCARRRCSSAARPPGSPPPAR
jgi:hypothetical protein